MKSAKHVVLLGGVLGVVACFLPYAVFTAGSRSGGVSAFDVLRGIEQVSGIQGLESKSVGTVLLVFGPPVLLLFIGLAASARGRLGRLGGLVALLIGGWACVTAASLMSVNVHLGELHSEVGTAAYALLAAGAVGGLGGLAALIKPDRGGTI